MIINLGDAPFKAYIEVTYPKGSCTCSMGSTTYSHSGGGTAIFEVNKKGTWTITASYLTASESGTVTVSTRNETKALNLTMRKYLYKPGDECSSVTGGWSGYKNCLTTNQNGYNPVKITPSVSKSNSGISASLYGGEQYGLGGCLSTANKIDLSPYSNLAFSATNDSSGNSWTTLFFVGTSRDSASASASLGTNKSINISSINTSCYVGISMANYYHKITSTLTSCYLEV